MLIMSQGLFLSSFDIFAYLFLTTDLGSQQYYLLLEMGKLRPTEVK